MLAQRLIERKRDGKRLETAEWMALVRAYTSGHVPDYQMAAFLMAAYLQGLDSGEVASLTSAMLRCGRSLDLSHLDAPCIDKHSTGGVGDKVSLVLVPLVASLGTLVPMMAGRSLGHTGGTLDRIEAIPGLSTALTLDDVGRQVAAIGCAIFGQTDEIAPADRRMYALRDATATVDAIPLIAASIMSKKLAEGLSGLVLDVKYGSGAFLSSLAGARELAHTMIGLGVAHDCPTVAVITAMDRPLGRAVGTALEVEEAILGLRGEGPADLMEVTYALGAEMLVLGGASESYAEARRHMEVAISSGRAAERMEQMIASQGGDAAVIDDPSRLPQADVCELYRAARSGFVARVEPRAIGRGLHALGGLRSRIDDGVDHGVGFVITARPGDWVEAGEPLATIFARRESQLAAAQAALQEGILIGEEADLPLQLIHSVIGRSQQPETGDT